MKITSAITPVRLVFIGVAGCCCLAAFFSSVYAPGFSEGNKVAGIELWFDHDPGAWYLQSAHEIFRKPAVFCGHPGIPMQWGNVLVQKVISGVYRGENESYTACIVRKLYLVQVWSRILVTLMWLATAWMVKGLTEKLFKNSETGYLAGILWLTSFPVIYYLNRISIEPHMLFFFLLSFYCLLLACDHGRAGHWNKTLGFSCAAASASVAAFYSKIHLFGPFPVFMLACLSIFLFRPLRWRRWGAGLLLSLVAALFTAACFQPFMDWPSFLRGWAGKLSGGRDDMFIAGMNVITQIGSLLRKISLDAVLPLTDPGRMIFATEYGVILLYFFSFFCRVIRENKVLMAMSTYSIFPTYIFVYRGHGQNFEGFHYLFPLLVVCCVHAAYVIHAITYSPSITASHKTAIGSLTVVLIIHFTAVVFGVHAHLDRIEQGQHARQVYLALMAIKPGERLPVEWQSSLSNIGITTGNRYGYGPPSLIENEVLRRQHE